MQTRSISFGLSALIHLLIIGVGTLVLITPPEFAVKKGRDSVEVSLVAAPPPPPVDIPPPPPKPDVPLPVEPPPPPKPDDLTVPTPPPIPPPPTPPPPQPPVEKITPTPPKPQPVQKKHTPAKATTDAASAVSDAGATTDVEPDYDRNPPPAYPEAARQKKLQGTVTLDVTVSTDGRTDSVSISKSSGYSILDQAAIKTVRNWRFRPASVGGIKVKASVIIPVQFQLDN